MKLGLVTDIHEDVENLEAALATFAAAGVEQVVVIGDVFRLGERIAETCRLLAGAGAVGVWGNHDYGLSTSPREDRRRRYGDAVAGFMASLRPRLEVDGCLFTHVEPWLDPEDIADLWYYGGYPDAQGQVDRLFAAAPHRVMFAGHYHRWLAFTPEGRLDWAGECAIRLSPGARFFVVVGALCEGRYATYDTATGELTPYRVPGAAGGGEES